MGDENGESRMRWHLQQRELECYNESQKGSEEEIQGFCPTTWDGLLCWAKHPSGSKLMQPCPDYVNGFNSNQLASKLCTEEGVWYFHPDKNSTWTDYSQCLAHDNETNIIREWIPVIKKMSQVGYGISFVTLLLAFFILISIKKLRCPRNTLHIHLFLSFMLRAFVTLLKHALFVEGIGLSASLTQGNQDQTITFKHHQSNWECKLVTSLWEYFLVANYTWILMEGLYLHNLIFLAPFSDSSAITLYVLLGWGCPLLVVGCWVGARASFEDTYCWTTHDNKDLFLIIRIPIIISIVLNFVFFLNIVRVLLLKLQSAVSIETRKYRYRKWAKSTLVLVPLFGVHYMLFLWMSTYVGRNPVIEVTWLFCDQFFASFQGCFVSILYCLINGEVRSELNKKWNKWKSEADSKNIWVPLNQISSKFYHRSTHDDLLAHNGSGGDHGESRHRFSTSSTCCGGGLRGGKGSHRDTVKSTTSDGQQLSPTRTTQIEEHLIQGHAILSGDKTVESTAAVVGQGSPTSSRKENGSHHASNSDEESYVPYVSNHNEGSHEPRFSSSSSDSNRVVLNHSNGKDEISLQIIHTPASPSASIISTKFV